MKKVVYPIIFILFFASFSSAEVFLQRFYLEGYAPLKGNEIDFFKLHEGYSITSHPRYALSGVKLTTEKEIDYEERTVKFLVKYNKIELYPTVYITLDSYAQNNFCKIFRNLVKENSKELLSAKDRAEGAGIIPEIVIDLPKIALPKAVRKFMGNKAGRLSLDGSQKLTFSGSSTSRNEPGDEDDRKQDFDLQMRQDLNLRLKGTIGEKIHVNVTHQSTSDEDVMPTPTEINVNYEGNEDEVVRSIDGGNISLSLSGSKFFRYSASSEGLFGIKSGLEAGNLKITTILGKDEAKKSTQRFKGSTQADSTVIESRNFVKRTHYFIDQPELLYKLYDEEFGIEGVDYPHGWKDNAIATAPNGEWYLTSTGADLLPDPDEEVTLYVDDGNASNNNITIEGIEIINPDITYHFDIMTEGTDFIIDYDAGLVILTLSQNISKLYTIGITYTRIDGQVIGNDLSTPVEVKLLRKSNQDFTDVDYWNLQVRNIYSLGMQSIKNEGFDLNVYSLTESNTPDYNIPPGLIEETMTYNEYLRLDSNVDGVINGDDKPIHLDIGYIVFPFLRPFYSLEDSLIYVEEEVQYNEFYNYISVKGKIGRDQIDLRQMNILQGSVIIKIGPNKKKLVENIDYIVDYDFGIITFLTAEGKDSDVDIDISFQYKPLFSVESKTILGFRADMKFNDNLKLGGTFIYQSEKVKEDRPKIGNENRSIILTDIDGEIEYELPFLTRAIDWLPLIKTDEESSVTLSGEVAMSIPRIYGSPKQKDKKEAYVDDMESILDTYPLGVTRGSWDPASRPGEFPNGNYVNYGRAKINFYNPQDIYAREVFDPESLTEKEEREKVSVLACKIKPLDLGMPGMDLKHWAGVMKYIGNEVDFSKKKYIEILAKVDTLNNQPTKPVIIHIDLGKVNENFYTFTDENGEGILDMEDGLVARDGILDGPEDVGLDRIPDGEPGDDPDDNYSDIEIKINGETEYPEINGTEGNNKLDSEDLDDNGILNMEDVYFEYSVCLNDGEEFLESQYKGWRLYRIPLHDPDNYRIISNQPGKVPNIKKISYARVWFEVEDSTRVKVVSLDITGNKWEEGFIKDKNDEIIFSEDESMIVGIIDNQKDPHYTPAPYTVLKERGEETLEQSLIVDYNNLGGGHHGLVTQSFRDPFNFLSYNKIRFWIYAEESEYGGSSDKQDSLIIRMGSDSLHYYEIRHELNLQEYYAEMDRDGWEEIEVKFSDLTHLKTLDDIKDTSYLKDGYRFSMKGNPTLTNIKEISLGMEATEGFSGRLYFDDIRVADPYEDIGYAARTTLSTVFADFSTLDIDLDWYSENFQSSAARTTSLTYTEQTQFNIVNRYYLNKFFPAEWGLSLPLILSRRQSLGIPRFQASSDVLRDNLSGEDKKRVKNKTLIYRADLSFSQNKTPKSKILAYTIKNTSISSHIEKIKTLNPTKADTTLSYSIRHTYRLSIPKEKIGIKLWGNYSFYTIPNSFENIFKYNDTDPRKWRWEAYTDSIPHWVVQSNTKRTRTFDTDTRVTYDIFSDIKTSYKLLTKRDLMLRNYWKGYNVGEEKERTQDITLDYTPRYLDNIFTYSVNASVRYDEDHIKSGTQDTLFYKGSVNRNIGGDFTLKNQDMLRSLANWLDKKFSKEPPQDELLPEKEEPEKEDQKIPESKGEIKEDELRGEPPTGELTPEEILAEKEPERKEGEEPKRKTNIFVAVINYISRIQNVKFNYNNIYKTSYDDRKERPDFLYQLGLPHILDEEGDDREILIKNITDKYSTSVGFPIINILSTSFGYSKEIKRTYGDHSSMQKATTFPNISVTLTEFEKLVGAESFLTSSRLTSSYVYTENLSGELDFKTPDSEALRMNFAPLISWYGNWIHNITSNISLNYSTSKNINHRLSYDNITKSQTQSMNGRLSWRFAAAKGLKILFFKRTRLTNEFTTDLNFTAEKTYNTQKGQKTTIIEVDKLKYTISPGASYEFNKNIHGGLTSNYEWSHDRKRETKVKTFRLGIWIEIMF